MKVHNSKTKTSVQSAQKSKVKTKLRPGKLSTKLNQGVSTASVKIDKAEKKAHLKPAIQEQVVVKATPKASPKAAVRSLVKSFVKASRTEVTGVETQQTAFEFTIGDNAVYPGHGVGKVIAIETKEILGKKQSFYSVQLLDSGMKIMIPKSNVTSVGLRPLISREEAAKVIDILRVKELKMDNKTWNRRYREYMEKIKTGSVLEIAEVLRDLFLLKADKELSFGERKMLDSARSLLLKELTLATGEEELFREDEVKYIFGIAK